MPGILREINHLTTKYETNKQVYLASESKLSKYVQKISHMNIYTVLCNSV